MRVITPRTKILAITAVWQKRCRYFGNSPANQAILKQLQALDLETAASETINSIIGDGDDWSAVYCDCCGTVVPRVVETANGEGGFLAICSDCLKSASELLDQSNDNQRSQHAV